MCGPIIMLQKLPSEWCENMTRFAIFCAQLSCISDAVNKAGKKRQTHHMLTFFCFSLKRLETMAHQPSVLQVKILIKQTKKYFLCNNIARTTNATS